MLLSTLPGIPNKMFDVRGLVFAQAKLEGAGRGTVEQMVQAIIQQATGLGADAIVDIKVVGSGGENGPVVMTGTAVKFW